MLPTVTVSAVADGGATETVVATMSNVSPPGAGATVAIDGLVNLTTAATGTSAVVARVRRGGVTGPLLGVATTDTVATATAKTIAIDAQDTPPDSASLTYVLTVTETGATANGTVNYAVLTGTIN